MQKLHTSALLSSGADMNFGQTPLIVELRQLFLQTTADPHQRDRFARPVASSVSRKASHKASPSPSAMAQKGAGWEIGDETAEAACLLHNYRIVVATQRRHRLDSQFHVQEYARLSGHGCATPPQGSPCRRLAGPSPFSRSSLRHGYRR